MVEEFYNNELPISSAAGWMQMESLLNKNLPVKKRPASIRLFVSWLPALLLSSIFVFSSLQLDRDLLKIIIADNAKSTLQNKNNINPEILNYNNNRHFTSRSRAVEKRQFSNLIFDNKEDFGILVKDQLSSADILTIEKISHQDFIKYLPEKTETNIQVIAQSSLHNQINPPNKIDVNKKHWEFSAGVGLNIAENKHQNLQPYPTAEVKYNLNAGLFISAGLSLLSPRAGSFSGVNKTVFINDTVNNISLYNEVVSYNRLRYVDVPISAGVNITKRLTFQMGVQLSVLASRQQKKSLQPFDFQMNTTTLPVTPTFAGAAANPQQEFTVKIPGMDYRFVSGIKYKFNRTAAGLFYQHGLQSSVSEGSNANTVSKGLFTFNLMYQFK